MKPEVLQTLLTAKVLFGEAQRSCLTQDKYTASAGLIVLQDSFELILMAILIEKGIDESTAIEKHTFDQLLGELGKLGIRVPRSGTLKAMNKQRVIVKHYGQLADPQPVASYFSVVQEAANNLLELTFGLWFDQIFLHELIRNETSRSLLQTAAEAIQKEHYFEALVQIRKAIFVEIESDYNIYRFRGSATNNNYGLAGLLGHHCKAPYHTRSPEWIEKNVKEPFNYIQLDHERLREELVEWGASTQDFFNIWRLTPAVMRLNEDCDWLVRAELKYHNLGATKNNAIFCLDRAVWLLWKKQSHRDLARWLQPSPLDRFRAKLIADADVYEKADAGSAVKLRLSAGSMIDAKSIVPGLDGTKRFAEITLFPEGDLLLLRGYVGAENCEMLEAPP